MFGNFLAKLKQGGFAGKAQNSAPMPALSNVQNQGMATGGFVGPMVNQGMAPMKSAGPIGMNRAPGFGFMRSTQRVPMTGPQNKRPNRNRLRSF